MALSSSLYGALPGDRSTTTAPSTVGAPLQRGRERRAAEPGGRVPALDPSRHAVAGPSPGSVSTRDTRRGPPRADSTGQATRATRLCPSSSHTVARLLSVVEAEIAATVASRPSRSCVRCRASPRRRTFSASRSRLCCRSAHPPVELLGHVVEALGQAADLVPAARGQPHREVAVGGPLGRAGDRQDRQRELA